MGSDIRDHVVKITKMNGFTPLPKSDKKEKRLDYLEWDEYFMAMTFLELRRSSRQENATIILNQRKIITSMATSSIANEENDNIDTSHFNHAEHKALCKIQEGSVMYTTSFPCEKCAEAIINAGITEIIYYRNIIDNDNAKELLQQNRVICRQFVSNKKKIEMDFSQYCDDSS